MAKNKLTGQWGEVLAAAFLKKKRYKIIACNYSCRFGEIDLIAKNRQFIVFVEVKLRKSADFAQAREFVDLRKQSRIRMTAELWLSQNETQLQPRFDVIEIYAENGVIKALNHLENAFELSLF